MSTRVKALGFAAVLVLAFGAAYGVGRLFDDGDEGSAYRLRFHAAQGATRATGETAVDLRFSVLGAGGDPVTAFAVRHEKRLHLIAVSKDFVGFRHLHPTMASDGTWSVAADLRAGDWRVYADFQPAGAPAQVLHDDVQVSGTAAFVADEVDAGEVRSATTEDGAYDGFVTGDLVAGQTSKLTVTISQGDEQVTDLEPYLGAYGHLVAIRESNLEYLHVHPEDGPSGPTIPFQVEVPATGRYHLYLDFKVGGLVRTAAFTLDAEAGAGTDHGMEGMDHDDH